MASAPPTKAPAAATGEQPAAVENKPTQPTFKTAKGVVKSVLSGDTIIVLDDKPNPTGPPADKIITLSSLQAPRFARGQDKEDPFAWESREFLRKKIVGKKVQYSIDHSTGTREYVTVYLAPIAAFEPECVNITVAAEGWAAVKEGGKKPEALVAAGEAAVQANKGIYSKEAAKPVGKNDEDADTLFRQLKGKPISAIVEQVRTGTSVRVTILPSRHTFQILLSGAQSNGWRKKEGAKPEDEPQPEPFAREAKYFVENHVLQREVTLNIDGVAQQGPHDKTIAFLGSIEAADHDLAEELLKAGMARYVAYSAAPRGQEWVAKLKAAEASAKAGKRRLFQDYVAPKASTGDASLGKEFTGRVVNILNSGAVAVVPEGATNEVQINLSSIKLPRPGFPGDEEQDAREPNKAVVLANKVERYWAAEGKELLRRRLIGQKVRIVFDYTRVLPQKDADAKGPAKGPVEKNFYSVYHNEQNMAVVLIESGFAGVAMGKQGDERSLDFEYLLMAENKAKETKRGLHMAPEKVPARRLNDLCIDNDPEKRNAQIARTKQFLPSFEHAGPMKAIVDYVFSGARFKVTVPKQSAVFMFALSGLRVPKRDDKDVADAADLSNAALGFARERLNQYEVTLEVDGVDKGGNFVGNLLLGKKNFSVMLLEQGYAYLHYASAERLKEFKELQTAEESAKGKKLGVWKNYDEEEEKRKAAAAAAEAGEAVSANVGKSYEVVVTEVVDGARLYVQIEGPESAGLEELVTQLTELSVTEGTGIPLLTPKVGELVRGKFSEDERWYRAKVVEIKDGKYKLQYIDYGNSEFVPADRIRALPPNSNALPHQAQLAALAFIKPLKSDHESARDATDLLRDLAGGKKLKATVEYRDQSAVYLILVDPTDDLNIAGEMLRQGFARLERGRRKNSSNPNFLSLREIEDKAKSRRAGIWHYGDMPDSDEDEKEMPKKGAAKPAAKDAKAAAAAPAEKPAGGKKK